MADPGAVLATDLTGAGPLAGTGAERVGGVRRGSGPRLANWAGNYVFSGRTVRPRSLEECASLLGRADSARVLGSRHSFTAIADSGTLLELSRLAGADHVAVDPDAMTVTVGPQITYARLARVLEAHGLALENLASLPHISVAGAVATATHGSGDRRANLAAAVRGMTLLSAEGELVELGPADPRLGGAAVHLGLLGLVWRTTLRVVPDYQVAQHVYEGLGWDALLENLDAVMALGDSVSVFHRLGPAAAVWVKRAQGDAAVSELPAVLFGARQARGERHPVPGADVAAATPQGGVPGPWAERLPHFRSGFMPSAGEEIQSEVFVARDRAADALRALLELADRIDPALILGELRSVAADELWLSPQHGRDSLGLHFTWRRDVQAVSANVALIAEALAPWDARPHWGKAFSAEPGRLARQYPRATDFARLRAALDPRGVFVNDWTRRHVPFLADG